MQPIEFSIHSKSKDILSKRARLFNYAFGILLVLTSMVNVYKCFQTGNLDFTGYSSFFVLFIGILWLVRGYLGINHLTLEKYILISNDSLKLKKPFRKEIQLSNHSMEWIRLKPSKLNLKTRDKNIDFDLNWISFTEFQQLKNQFVLFCDRNEIEMKYN